MHPKFPHNENEWARSDIRNVPTPDIRAAQAEDDSLVPIKPSILIVDDCPEILGYLHEGLTAYGYHCLEANHGLEALQKIQTTHVDVLLTDLNMPFLDGMGLAHHLYDQPALRHVMIIMMTASDPEMFLPLAQALGIKKILPKPCTPLEIHQIIQDPQIRTPKAA